jgi:hypothetical protein
MIHCYMKFCIILFIVLDVFCSQNLIPYNGYYAGQVITQNTAGQNPLFIPMYVVPSNTASHQTFSHNTAAVTNQTLTPIYREKNQLPQKTIADVSKEINKYYEQLPLFPSLSYEQEAEMIVIAQNNHFTLEDYRLLRKQNLHFKRAVTVWKNKIDRDMKFHLHRVYINQLATITSLLFPATINNETVRTYIMNKVYNIAPFDYKIVLPHPSFITTYDFCLEHNLFVALTQANEVYLWDLTTGNRSLLTIISEQYSSLKASHDGQYTVIHKLADLSQSPSLEIWSNKEKCIKYIWQNKDLPKHVHDIIYINPRNIIIRGKNKENEYLSDYYLTEHPAEPIKRTLPMNSLSHQLNESNPKMIYFNDVFNQSIVIPRKSIPLFLLTSIINNAPKNSDLETIKTTAEYASLHLIQKELINKLIEDNKKDKTLFSSLSERFSSSVELLTKGYCIL